MISQSDLLRAVRNRTPDSFAPDGAPLKWVTRGIDDLSDNEKSVMAERRFGWEQADYATLGRIFCVHPTTARHICEQFQRKQREA